ncbi:hypothetical protein CcaverHIS002_0300330 [Cutaneotrichosporon cavernicola]|uniref:Glyoxalase-like domain-containing protein n=1 Tax=Cutaneotrichosporon cavernicola TaxID=279322 RepID=A0AA48L2Q1_9TREE|nr:uncharacterized protein CcaverHIS019_0300330 [Cutaneotrichosporon cavernicola]BEI82165.1 hypothetical protein CcaverHIS002_0300330 [Cutaneotrichosporon cavernicola]BEI89963.1 hypothetical protein CcaverHIS019_0300330 [Cutaneotrichosporon cavernicola]BEI97736.1 hypothetical protein CcaverHIS631_0300350 [Cutaneotrichosporon cavernicola]BEJ05513.1 hypothetical protein CcaverHIS641_0300350 [Cutaneotrichosporon cavernicola]
MPHTEPDHLVITAATLDAGVAWVEERLGVSLSPRRGGQHDRQGTHNALLSLGPDFYLEVIAINPDAPVPDHPRWFGMDTVGPEPRLHHWVCRTSNLADALEKSAIKPGEIEQMSRGTLRWLITIAPDGQLKADGTMPSLIEWQSKPHPAAGLEDKGYRLQKLEVHHPRAQEVKASLSAAGMLDTRVEFATGGPMLSATIQTPSGPRVLG